MTMEKLYKLDGEDTREYTQAEYDQHALDVAEYNANLAKIEAELAAAAAAKAAAEAKLTALGLTEDDLKALGLGTN